MSFGGEISSTQFLLNLPKTSSSGNPARQSTVPQLQNHLWHFFQKKKGDNIKMFASPNRAGATQGPTCNVLSSTIHNCLVVRARTEPLSIAFNRVCHYPSNDGIRHILPAKRQPSCLEGARLRRGSANAGCNWPARASSACILIQVSEVDSSKCSALTRLWTVAASSEPWPRARAK